MIKKFIAIVLCLCFITTIDYSVSAADNVKERFQYPSNENYFELEHSEDVYLNGIRYEYDFQYNKDGYRTINIENHQSGEVSEVVFDDNNGNIFLNNELVATVKKEEAADDAIENPIRLKGASSNTWVFKRKVVSTITWEKAIAAYALAAIIAGAITVVSMPVAEVVAAMGMTTLTGIIGLSYGAKLTELYYLKEGTNSISVKDVWSFKPTSGETYGPYTYISTWAH